MCRVLQVSVSGYYAWRQRTVSLRAKHDAKLTEQVEEIFARHRKRYGSPRIHAELQKKHEHVSRKRVARLMRERGLFACRKRKTVGTTTSNHHEAVAPNLLDRKFKQDQLNKVWVGDITYIPTHKGFAYLATVMDLCSRRIIGWQISDRIDNRLVCMALWRAAKSRRDSKQKPAVMFHSDRGSQYASRSFRGMLGRLSMQQSMSRKGNCWDNAVAESFFKTFKEESDLVREMPRDHEYARVQVYRYIEFYYNRQRIHSSLGYQCPIDFERRLRFGNLISLH
jgi:putative transposase